MRKAGHWFLASGIQDPDGGVARYYLNAFSRPLAVSTEITGYAASTLAYLYKRTGDPEYLAAAERAAHFLLGRAWDPELETFAFEIGEGSPGYFFDLGIIIRGLLAVWRLTGETKLASTAIAAGRSMARDYLTETAIHPVIALPSRQPLPYEKRWSREPGCFQLKSALAWRELAALPSGPDAFHSYWERALEQARATGETFLPGADDRLKVMDRLHAYSYYMEALLAERSPLLAVTIPRTAAYLRDIAPEFARSDVYAQLLRVRLFADALGVVPLDRAAAAEEAAAIATFQYDGTGDARFEGGYCFGRKAGELLPFVNPVSTGFCLQALDQWQLHQAGEFQPELADLI